jgi:hypothetical protein
VTPWVWFAVAVLVVVAGPARRAVLPVHTLIAVMVLSMVRPYKSLLRHLPAAFWSAWPWRGPNAGRHLADGRPRPWRAPCCHLADY